MDRKTTASFLFESAKQTEYIQSHKEWLERFAVKNALPESEKCLLATLKDDDDFLREEAKLWLHSWRNQEKKRKARWFVSCSQVTSPFKVSETSIISLLVQKVSLMKVAPVFKVTEVSIPSCPIQQVTVIKTKLHTKSPRSQLLRLQFKKSLHFRSDRRSKRPKLQSIQQQFRRSHHFGSLL